MQKLLLFLALLYGIYLVRRLLTRKPPAPTNPPTHSPTPPEGERMVECAFCEILVPESESVRDGSHHFCSEEHQRQGPKRL